MRSRRGIASRALARRPQPPRDGVSWVAGALEEDAALAVLMQGADAVVHVAGVVNAPDRAGFAAGNVDGTRTVIAAARNARVARFIHVSSLSAREPQLSAYGWSKAEAETLVEASGLDWTIVRPTGVYGPGDTELRDMFRLARFGLALLPPAGLVSLVHVDDLARLLLTLAERGGPKAIYDVDDGTVLSHADLGRAIGAAVGRRVLPLHLPRAVLNAAAWFDRAVRGDPCEADPPIGSATLSIPTGPPILPGARLPTCGRRQSTCRPGWPPPRRGIGRTACYSAAPPPQFTATDIP